MSEQPISPYQPTGATPETKIPSTEFDDVVTELKSAREQLIALIRRLTPAERRRMLGAGVRRYGLIDKTMDYAQEYSQFVPPTFSLTELRKSKLHIEVLRDIQILTEEINRLVGDGLLIESTDAMNQTLIYYNSVREQARRNVSGAVELFDKLKLLFTRRRSPDSPETEPEVERNAHALLHGQKDGKIIIENERPHLVGGKHVVVDETHRDQTAWKETEQGEINE